VEQTFSAPSEDALRAELDQKGLYLFSVRRGLGLGDLRLRRRRVAPGRLLVFGQELAALLKAGLPLLGALDIMLERHADPLFHRSLTAVRDRVRSGSSLSDAFKAEGALYPPVLAATLVAGERSGSLETVLRRFVQYLRLNQALRKKALSASIYPLVLLLAMGGLVSILLVFVIPNFQTFFEGMDVELPLVTRAMIATGTWIADHLGWIALGMGVAAVLAFAWWRGRHSRVLLDRFLLKLPYLGGLMQMFATSQLCRTLSTLLSGGLPLVTALEVSAESVGNRAVGEAVGATTRLIREGRSLSAALESSRAVEPLTLDMVKVGEQTGALAEMLSSIAEFYDEELDTRIATVLALTEPVLLVLMALIVAGMLLAFYLPLFQAISAATGGR
jgi:type IV pilus assembly protein PilC